MRGTAKSHWSRRKFVACSSVVSGGLALSGCATMSVLHVAILENRIRIDLDKYPDLRKNGSSVLLKSSRDPILLLHMSNGEYRALSAICTHLSCNIRMSGKVLQCPCHGSTFDLDGNAIRGPAQRPLKIYESRRLDGAVEILL